LRFGVGSDFSKGRQADYVLGNWKPDEDKALPERIQTAASAAKSFVFDGLPMAMTNWNNK
jgi:PTH1 family peptidyl-tRNA hydrolase